MYALHTSHAASFLQFHNIICQFMINIIGNFHVQQMAFVYVVLLIVICHSFGCKTFTAKKIWNCIFVIHNSYSTYDIFSVFAELVSW